VRLDAVCDIIMGQAPAGDEYNDKGEGLPLLAGAGDFKSGRPVAKKFTRVVTKQCVEGDLVIGIRASIGDMVVADRPYCLGRGVAVIRPKAKEVVPRYLWHWMASVRPALEQKAKGATFKQVNRADIGELRLSVPTRQEQLRIAAILDQAEELRAKRRAAIALLDKLPQALFLKMFGDPVSNPMCWNTKTVDSLCKLVRGSSPRPQGDSRYFGGPVPRLMIADITRDGLNVTPRIDSLTLEGAKKSRPVPAGTVAMAVSGNIGLVSKLTVDACIHDGFVAFTELDDGSVSADFLLHYLNSAKALHDRNMAGAIFINIKTDDIKALQILVPHLSLQNEFLKRVSALASVRTTHQMAVDEADALIASLQDGAFGNGGI